MCTCCCVQTVTFLTAELAQAEFKVACLHGERAQEQRKAAVAAFKAGKVQILVATDVAARGLHVKNLPYIVNYDFPGNIETYIHRAGRTGAHNPQRHCVDLLALFSHF
jgi:superfamily II DNA/RNA helicase